MINYKREKKKGSRRMTFGEIVKFFLGLLTGTGMFLIGVQLLTSNIEQLATSKIKKLFNKTANKKIVNVGIGALTTAIIQSSGVTTVLIVGFVNVGMMSLFQATTMIMGANIGTTITAQIASLSAFPITDYIKLLTFIGIMLAMFVKKDKIKKIGYLLAGLGLVFIGLSFMSGSMSAYKQNIQGLFSNITSPLLLFMVGIVLTALVQSSSATTSIIIAMSIAGLTIGTGGNEVLFFILGTNIGSCVTALMSSMGAGTNAKRTSLIHLMFNVFGSMIFFILLVCYKDFMKDTFQAWFATPATQIAMFHTFFNTICTLLFLPFAGVFVKIAQFIIKDKKQPTRETYLDERMITSFELAITSLEKELFVLGDEAMEAFNLSYKAFHDKDVDLTQKVNEKIDNCAEISKNITDYMVKLSANCSGVNEEKRLNNIHNDIGDIMRIAEIASNFIKYTNTSIKKDLEFSNTVKQDLDSMVDSIALMYSLTKKIICEKDLSKKAEVELLEEKIDTNRKKLIDEHIERLNKKECNPANSSVFINLVSNIERLGDHITYIAQTV